MMKALFFVFHGFNSSNGISKKIVAQVKALQDCGVDTCMCHYDVEADGNRVWKVNETVLTNLGNGIIAKFKKRMDYRHIYRYIIENEIALLYIRSDHNANPFLVLLLKKLKRKGLKIIIEIPTYPYDQEYDTCKRKCKVLVDQIFRKILFKQINSVVTFSDAESIFGQRTIRISNGIDFSTIPLKQPNSKPFELHLIGVAEIHYWHGFDRLIAGLRKYYQSENRKWKVYFHLVGDFFGERERSEIVLPIIRWGLSDCVIMYGKLFDEKLDEVFDKANLGIGSLARHRSQITHIKTLKNREYAARGIPFVYSEIDDDFENMPYVLKINPDEEAVDIDSLIEFYQNLKTSPVEIRKSVEHLSWKNQMQRVLSEL